MRDVLLMCDVVCTDGFFVPSGTTVTLLATPITARDAVLECGGHTARVRFRVWA